MAVRRNARCGLDQVLAFVCAITFTKSLEVGGFFYYNVCSIEKDDGLGTSWLLIIQDIRKFRDMMLNVLVPLNMGEPYILGDELPPQRCDHPPPYVPDILPGAVL